MPSDTPSPFWKKLVPKPSGAIPGGLLTQVGIGLFAIIIAAMLISQQFCGAGEPQDTATAQQQEPVAGGAGFDRRIAGMTQQQRREQDHQDAAEARRAQIAEQEALAAGLGGGRVSRDRPGSFPGGRAGSGPGDPQYQTEAEFELMERMRLEDMERQRRSLRVGTVVLTHRTARRGEEQQAPAEPGSGSEPAPPASNPAAAMQEALIGALAASEPPTPPLQAPAAAPVAAPAPAAAAASPLASAGNYSDPTRLVSPVNPAGWDRIYEGSFLEGVLVTQLSGEFTGPVLAMVSVPFYTADRQRIIVPRGTRAIGAAQAVGGQDQERLAVGFHRLVFPDGRWLELTFDGLDQAGSAALKDKVNRHYLSMFAAVGAVGVLSGLTLRGSNPYGGGQAGFRAGAGQGLGQAGMQILSRFLNRRPTITIRAGHRLRIWFTNDVLVPRPPPQGGQR